MMPLDETNIRPALMAYADGELDGEQRSAVLEYLIAHPQWLAVLRDDQRLCAAARRVMREHTPKVPDSVRDRIAALAAETTRSSEASTHVAPPLQLPRRSATWWPVAAAATIALVFGLAARDLLPSRGHPQTGTTARMPVELVSAVTRVHVDCSRFPLVNHGGPFPATGPSSQLADDVRRAFHTEASHPDLSAAGFTFVGAGPCRRPLDETIHLLYRADDPARRETLSVFVQPDHGQVDIPQRQINAMTPADAPHPSYVWRSEGAVFFLVTDAGDVADKARQFLQVAMAR